MTVVLNFVLFQAGWLACVLGAARGWPGLGVLVVVIALGWHVARARRPRRELALVALCAASGAIFETLLVQSGWVRFESGMLLEDLAPYWMVALWALFATTLNVSLRSLRSRPMLAALLGAVGGPLAYLAGSRLGALQLDVPSAALLALVIGWASLTPLLLSAARRLDGYAHP